MGPGVSSDILVRNYQAQRFWLVTTSTILFCIAQVCALSVETPYWLFLVSGISGLAYGMLFGVFPTIVRFRAPALPGHYVPMLMGLGMVRFLRSLASMACHKTGEQLRSGPSFVDRYSTFVMVSGLH